MINRAHQKSLLPIQDMIQVADDNTIELFHMDISPNGTLNGTKPVDDIYDDSLICWLEMQEQNIAGTYVTDKSRYGNHGRIVGPVFADGRNGKTLSFDGVDDYISFDNIPYSNLSSCSISFWRKDNGLQGWLLFKGQTTSHYIMATSGGTGAFYHDFIGSSWVIYRDGVSATVPLDNGQWHHYVITGVNLSSWTELYLCNYPGWHYKGLVDDLRIYSRVLSTTEITNLYNSSIYSLRPDGKYGNAIAIEEATVNIIPVNNWNVQTGWPSFWVAQTKTIETFNLVFDNVYVIKSIINEVGSGGVGYNQLPVSVTIGVAYTVSAYVKTLGRKARIWCHDGADGNHVWSDYNIANNQWTRLQLQFITTTATGNCTIHCYFEGGNTGDVVRYTAVQLEQKSFATSFVNGSRVIGNISYPINITRDCTISFWFKPDYKWYNTSAGYNKTLLQLYNSTTGAHIDYADWSPSIGTSMPFFDLEPNASWDGLQHHWHTTFNYDPAKWYMMNFIKQGNTIRELIYDNAGTKVVDITFTYSDSTLFANFSFDKLIINGSWCGCFDELRIDKVARTLEEIFSWYLSNCPFWPKGPEKVVL